jgi:hypothetical protein
MFNNVVLDIVVGLVFIYLLYSLLATVVAEFISTKLGIRARLLRFSIEKMLNDGYYEKMDDEELDKSKPKSNTNILEWWLRGIRRLMLYENANFNTSFAGKFYAYPTIKYLGKVEKKNGGWFSHTKPSYFSAENFADTMIHILKEKGMGTTDEEKVDFCLLFNTHNIQNETLKHFLSLWDKSAKDLKAFKKNLMKWFDETMDRTTGWHKQKMQLISLVLGFILAALFNIDTIKITKILAKDKGAREQLVKMSIEFAKDSTRYKDFTSGHTDSLSRRVIDSSLTMINEDIQAASSVLGLGWHFSSLLKNKVLEIDNRDGDLFRKISEKKPQFSDDTVTYYSIIRNLNETKGRIKAIKDSLQQSYKDTLINYYSTGAASDKGSLEKLKKEQDSLKKQIARTNKSIVREKKSLSRDSLLLMTVQARRISFLKSINTLTGSEFISIDAFDVRSGKSQTVHIAGKVPLNFIDKVGKWFSSVYFNFFGLFLTAIAISFGGPFWFDILKKIIALRAVGVKPEEKKPPVKDGVDADPNAGVSSQQKKAPITVKGKDMSEEALLVYGPKIKSIAGVKSIFAFKDPTTRKRNVIITVIDNLTKAVIQKNFEKLIEDLTLEKPEIIVSGQPVTHEGKGMIRIFSSDSGSGSFGCVLHREIDKSFHILSCWHVMKDLSMPENSSAKILDHKRNKLAVLWAGNIREAYDYGIARCVNTASIQSNELLEEHLGLKKDEKLKFRAVRRVDIDGMIPIHYVNFLGENPAKKSGVLFTDSSEVDIEYADKVRTVKDILVLTKSPTERLSISEPGNSGSVIFDESHNALGMIIGGDSKFTYAIRLSNVLSIHKEMKIA